jgi:hypothetical protein
MGADAGRHGRADPQALVDPHQIVVRNMQRDCGTEVLDLLAERVRQAGEPAHTHPDRQVLALDTEIAPELTGHGLPLTKCEAYNRVYDQHLRSD